MFRFLLNLFSGKPLEGARSPQWSRERAAYLAEHKMCEACGGAGDLQCHHKKPFGYFPELELDRSNFQTLCEHPARNCHLNVGHSGDFKAYNPNSVEDAALMLKRLSERKYTR